MPLFKKDKAKESDRGVNAEKEVQNHLDSLSTRYATFDYLRLPDAKAAMGRMKAMPADFDFHMPGMHGLIEVKQTLHEYRLTSDKFPQLPRMRKRMLAGGICRVVVHHSTLGLWRCVDVACLDPSASSWDLREFKGHPNAQEALAWLEDYYAR